MASPGAGAPVASNQYQQLHHQPHQSAPPHGRSGPQPTNSPHPYPRQVPQQASPTQSHPTLADRDAQANHSPAISAAAGPPHGSPSHYQIRSANDGTPVKKRGTVACRRCRRLRSKCLHEKATPPCEACKLAGPQAVAECSFPRRGERDVDRQFRRRPFPVTGALTTEGLPHVPGETTTGVANSGYAKPYAPSASTGSITTMMHVRSPGSSAGQPGSGESPRPSRSLGPVTSVDSRDALPPPDQVVEGCRIFVTSYFQLGFIPKAVFLERLQKDPESVSKFLLTCILAISARFTPSLIRRYGGAKEATDYFLEVSKGMVAAEMYKPSLERIQAFFLLSIAQWGSGDRDRSSMDMGIAVRMAGLLKLHCEESYVLNENSPAEQVVRSESARRVFWMIQSQENLHSAYKSPAPFPLEDITTLLPCNEADFAFGAIPSERAAVAGTPPAIANPSLVSSPRRCLFATLIQAHGLWGNVARRACRTDYTANTAPPWDPKSEYQRTTAELRTWEEHLPPKHAFSVWNLRGWSSESLHLAYLAVTMVLRLSNIVARRIYMDDMLSTITNAPVDQTIEPPTPTMGNATEQGRGSYPLPTGLRRGYGPSPAGFWAKTSDELFVNVWELHEQVDAYFNMRSPDEGFPQILVFCVYMCGSLASYLWRYPSLCPQLADRAEMMAQRSLEVLSELHGAWPTSSKWKKGLQQIATPLSGVSPADEKTPSSSSAIVAPGSQPAFTSSQPQIMNLSPHQPGGPMYQGPTVIGPPRAAPVPEGILGDLINVLPNGNSGHLARLGTMQMETMPNELFNAELNAFLQGDFHYDTMDGWQHTLAG